MPFSSAIRPSGEQSSAYWLEQEDKRKGIMAEIEKIKRIEAAEGRTIKSNNAMLKGLRQDLMNNAF